MAPRTSYNGVMFSVLGFYFTTTALAGPILYEAGPPFPAGNSTNPLRKEANTPGNQTETTTPPEKKGIAEYKSLIIIVSVGAGIILVAVLYILAAKWRVHRRLAQRQKARQDAEASSGEVELTRVSTSATAANNAADSNGGD